MNANMQVLHPDYVQVPNSQPVISTAGRNLKLSRANTERTTDHDHMQAVSNKQTADTVKQPQQFDQMRTNKTKRPTEMPRSPMMKKTTTTTQALHTAAFTGLLFLALLSPATAADFSGNLKGVTITDAQAVNKSPLAAFTYSQDGQTILFDAGGSSDPDGNITKYKWNFGDGKVAEGVTATYDLAGDAPFKVTLTILDNNSGAALSQQTITPATKGILDNFSTDTTANYTVMSGKSLIVSDGVLHTSPWSTTVAYHNTSLGSNDHTVEANVVYAPEDGSGLLVRCDPQQRTGYLVYFESGRVYLNSYNNGKLEFISFFDGKYTAGTYRLSVTTKGSTITAAVNGTVVLTKTDSTFANGTHAGVRLRTGAIATSITVDNLVGN